MKLGISMPIKYKSTQKEIVLAKLKQCYGSKIVVHLLQDNEITESSPKALKDAKTWGLSGATPPGSHQGSKSSLWTPPVIARATRSVGATLTSCPGRHIQ